MPIYEYECSHCGLGFEKARKIKDLVKVDACPVCGSRAPLQVSFGFTHGDETPWLNDPTVQGAIKDGGPPLTGRQEYKDYLKANDIVERT